MSVEKIDFSKYHNTLGTKHKIIRLIWNVVWTLFARPMPRWLGGRWRCFLLRLFGAKISPHAGVHPSAKVYYPANLTLGSYACLASRVNCYNVAPISIGNNATVSEGAFLCTASHDITNHLHPLITAPIVIQDAAWVAAEAFVGMGVTIGEGAVVGARAAVFKDVAPWNVMGGNPAKFIKKRILTK